MNNDKIEEILNDFDKKFSKIVHMHRGECVITDSTGTEFQAHTDENGKVTEVGGLESVKDFIRATITTCADEIRKERVEHCSDVNCPECHKVAYEAGVKAERERVREWAKKQYFATTADGKRAILNNTLVEFLSDNH